MASRRGSTPKVSVVLPTHNELENLKQLIPQIIKVLRPNHPEIIVVDDASTDGSIQWLKKLSDKNPRVKPIFGSKLKGIGNALRRGYNASSSPIIVSLDADLSFLPSTVPVLICKINQGYDLVIGSRHHSKGIYQAPTLSIKRKRLISSSANFLLKTLLPIGVSDFSANCRAIRVSTWKKLKLKEKTNIWLIEMIVATAIGGGKIIEIPVKFRDRRFGSSKLKLGREIFLHGYRVISLISKFYASRFKTAGKKI